jgi:hypothetical protein
MMENRVTIFLLGVLLCLLSPASHGGQSADLQSVLLKKIPPRSGAAMTGSEFAEYVSATDICEREQAILDELLQGNLPDFLRELKPVRLTHRFEDGKTITATIFVMSDYLAIGSDRDFLSIPMCLDTATKIATRFGFILPTKRMVDAIYEQAEFHFEPEPMRPGPEMRSTEYYMKHQRKIEKQRRDLSCPLCALVSGHKKDVVLTNRLTPSLGKIAIYGWHRSSGDPIQPLSTVHRADYADYSHGIRLVSDTCWINGKPRSIYDVLNDPQIAEVLSDEGAIREARELMTACHQIYSLIVLQQRKPR